MAPIARSLLAVLAVLAVLACLPPRRAQAQSTPACQIAAQEAIRKIGAVYSQGGYLSNDPINPLTGTYYPRSGPDSFDCSGLVWWAYHQAGVDVGWGTSQQVQQGYATGCTLADIDGDNTSCWQAGDLAFLWYDGGQHVSMYVGSGLFVDAYNHATGVIAHDVSLDSFYEAHFWQARRVVDGCAGVAIDPGTPGTPGGSIPFEYPQFALIPDIVDYVHVVIPQCSHCKKDSTEEPIIQRYDPPDFPNEWGDWFGEGPWGMPIFTGARGIAKTLHWIGWLIREIILEFVCLFLVVMQFLVNLLIAGFNAIIYATNMAWRLAVFAWLTLRQVLYALWGFFDLVIEFFIWLQRFAALALAWLVALGDIVVLVLDLLGQVVMFAVDTLLALIGVLAWLLGLTVGALATVIESFTADSPPTQLDDSHAVYYMVRGILDAVLDSQLSFVVYVLVGFVYLHLLMWIARYFKST